MHHIRRGGMGALVPQWTANPLFDLQEPSCRSLSPSTGSMAVGGHKSLGHFEIHSLYTKRKHIRQKSSKSSKQNREPAKENVRLCH
ncbi:hypothetical protein PoB_000670000 [Plakobranchus ocellatus]|uniref:Uncharacterized protein n=1 Tax=Plakobranchus ocellatus TaxID=259542 RepID=A0AAV3YAW5_9GAST|nr:hypothetical protein PoB_000670000 [Plakobranchus ocellatus]